VANGEHGDQGHDNGADVAEEEESVEHACHDAPFLGNARRRVLCLQSSHVVLQHAPNVAHVRLEGRAHGTVHRRAVDQPGRVDRRRRRLDAAAVARLRLIPGRWTTVLDVRARMVRRRRRLGRILVNQLGHAQDARQPVDCDL